MASHVSVLSSGFSYLLVSQVSSRLVTFSLNLLVTRLLSPEAYGLAAVQFHLINTVILFLSREGFRRGCLRTSREGDTSDQAARRTLVTSALCIPLGLLVTGITCKIAYSWQDDDRAAIHHAAVRLQGAAAMVELLSEPLYILAAVQLRFRLRALVDTGAIIAKSAVTIVLLHASKLPSALALSWAQMAFAAVTLLAYAAAMAPQLAGHGQPSCSQHTTAAAASQDSCGKQQTTGKSEASSCDTADAATGNEADAGRTRQRRAQHPDSDRDKSRIDVTVASTSQQASSLIHLPTLWLCATFSLQAAEKLVLAEGSKMVMVGLQSSHNQGVYGLVVNLGSLVVRTVFQPFEEAAFTAFSTADGRREQSARLLSVLVRCVTIVGGISAAFGPAYSWLLLRLLYSERWSNTEAPAALAVYSFYILLLALNGVLEAFVHASANQRQLVRINVALVVFAAAHMGLSVVLVRLGGAVGLIWADSANMLIRILFSLMCVRQIFPGASHFQMVNCCPSTATIAGLLFALFATGVSGAAYLGPVSGGPAARLFWQHSSKRANWLMGHPFYVRAAAHIATGCACLLAAVLVVLKAESGLWTELRSARDSSRKPRTD